MRCRGCKTKYRLGGEPPGLFLTIAATCLAVSTIAALVAAELPDGFGRSVLNGLAIAFGLAILLALAAVWTNMIDGCSMGPDGYTLGGNECRECGSVNPIRPWSW